MSNLKQLRIRIQSISSTKKITSAMKMVAAAKLKKSQERAENAQPYSLELSKILDYVLSFSDIQQVPIIAKGDEKLPVLIVLFASDRGLCGGFNTNLFKMFSEQVKTLHQKKRNFYCLGIGKRAITFLKNNYAVRMLDDVHYDIKSPQELMHFVDYIVRKIETFEFGGLDLIYTQFKNILHFNPSIQTIVPFQKQPHLPNNNEQPIFEPQGEVMLPDLIKNFIRMNIYHALLQSEVSEHASRMSSMDNATRNANDMVNQLKLHYNRTRQSMITKELIEIISGAETSATSI